MCQTGVNNSRQSRQGSGIADAWRRVLRTAGLICALFVPLFTPQTGQSMGARMTSDPLPLYCPDHVPHAQALCAAVAKALAKAAGQSKRNLTPVLLGQGQAVPANLAPRLSVVVTRLGETHLDSQLAWSEGGAHASITGPEITLSVMDAPIRASMYDRYARGLLASSPEVVAAVRTHFEAPPEL